MGERAVAVAVRRALLRACASLDRSPDLRYLMIRDGAGPAGPFRREEVEEGRPAAVAFGKYLALRPRGAGPAAGAPPSAVRLAAEGYRAEAGGRWQEGALVHDALRALRYARTFLSCPGTAKVAEGGMGFGRAWDPSAEDEGAYLHRELEAQRERLVLERLAAYDDGRRPGPPAARRGGRRSPRGRRRRLLYHVLPRVIDLIDGGAHTAAGSAAAGRPASRRQRRRNKRRPLRDEMTDREA